jgi:HrpA-like RNA helicase
MLPFSFHLPLDPAATALPVVEALPALRARLVEAPNAVLIAPPGAGKTTLVPLALHGSSWLGDGRIVMLEPRRLAARAAAQRMASLIGQEAGELVGFRTRLDSAMSDRTRIEVVTEGLLVRRLLSDPTLDGISCVILDEVHERSLDADTALAFCLDLQRTLRPELRLLAMSATVDGAALAKRLDAPVIESAGRMFPVEVRHAPRDVPMLRDLPDAMARAVRGMLEAEPAGDVLAFLPGVGEIRRTQAALDGVRAEVLPLHGELPPAEQDRVLRPPPAGERPRRVILATSIAETSLTVPGVRHVIDSGKSKQRLFRPTLNIDSLLTLPISRSSANQRSGRAGRDAPGTAWRLYTERDFWQEMSQDGVPEVLRCDLAQLVLTLKAHGVADLARFPMLTKPPRKGLGRALTSLLMLGALDGRTGGITHVGREMSLLPLPGNLARVLLASVGFGCVDEVVDVVAALSVENLFVNLHHASAVGEGMDDTKGEEGEGEDSISDPRLALRARLHRREGDHLTLLATVQAYVQENSDRKRWCAERGISHRAMRSVLDVRKQLSGIMARKTTRPSAAVNADGEQLSATATPTAVSSSEEPKATHSLPQSDLNTRILKCLLTGLHPNVARLAIPASSGSAAANKRKSKSSTSTSDGPPPQYLTLTTNQPVSIHPSSVLFGRRVEAVVCSEFVFTSKSYARCVSAVELGWVREAQEQAQAGTVIQS